MSQVLERWPSAAADASLSRFYSQISQKCLLSASQSELKAQREDLWVVEVFGEMSMVQSNLLKSKSATCVLSTSLYLRTAVQVKVLDQVFYSHSDARETNASFRPVQSSWCGPRLVLV